MFALSVTGYLSHVFRYLDARFSVTAIYAGSIVAVFWVLAVVQQKFFENRIYGNGPLVKMNSRIVIVLVPFVYFVVVTLIAILLAVLVDQGVRILLGFSAPGIPKISHDDLRFNSARNEKLMFGLMGLIGTGLVALLIAQKVKHARSVLGMALPAMIWILVAAMYIAIQP
jgi:hypothetical protein